MTEKKYKCYIIVLTIVFICGCSRQPIVSYVNTNENGEIEFDLTDALVRDPTSYLDDMIDSIKIIPLETASKSLIGAVIWNIQVCSQYIFVQDNSNIFIFNRQGQWIKTLDKGPGPKEIGHPRAMSYDEQKNFLYVFDGMGFKIIKFNPKGDFLSYNMIPKQPIRDIAISDSHLLLAYHNYDKFIVSIGDTTGNMEKSYIFGSDQYNFLFRKYIMSYDGGFNIKKLLDNNIYHLKDSTIKAKYNLKYPMPTIDFSQYKSMRELESGIQEGKYLFTGDYMESQDYLLTYFNTSGFDIKVLLSNKTTGKSECIKGMNNSITSFITIETTLSTGKNWFVGLITPEYFISKDIPEEYRWDGSNPNNLISDEDMARLKAVKPDDNPIIVLFKLKDNI